MELSSWSVQGVLSILTPFRPSVPACLPACLPAFFFVNQPFSFPEHNLESLEKRRHVKIKRRSRMMRRRRKRRRRTTGRTLEESEKRAVVEMRSISAGTMATSKKSKQNGTE